MKKFLCILCSLVLLTTVYVPQSRAKSTSDSTACGDGKFIIMIDPGHGGIDSGAVNGSYYEKHINYDIATYMKEALEEYYSVEVYLTRNKDTENPELEERAILAQEANADLLISLHCNSNKSSSPNGAEVYYPNSNYIDNYVSDISYPELLNLAKNTISGLASLGIKNNGMMIRMTEEGLRYEDGSLADWYGMLREPKTYGVPSILIEHAYMSNYYDLNTFLKTQAQRKTVAMSNVDAIVKTFGLTTVAVTDLKITAPTKTEYTVGQTLDTKGLTVTATFSNGTKKTLSSSEYKLTGFSNKDVGNKVVTVSYMDSEAKFLTSIVNSGTDTNIIGDVNGDGEIKATDYLIIKDSFLNGLTLSNAQKNRADVKEDNVIKATDYLMIKDYFLGKLEYLRPTPTPTATPTATPTPTPVASSSPSPSEAPSTTPDNSASPIPSEAPSTTPDNSASPIPSEAPSASPDNSASPIPSEAPSTTPDASTPPEPTDKPDSNTENNTDV